jgi:uncharacterized protein YcnI
MRATLTVLALLAAAPAFAHVTLEQPEAAPGTAYKAVFRVPHGCAGSATTKFRVQIPEGVIAVKPMPKPGWTLEIAKGRYAKPYSFLHGATVSEGVKEVAWSGKLPDDYYDEFVLSGFVADALSPGAVYFPVIQECEKGEQRWVETPAAGQNSHELKAPAPMLRLVAAEGTGDAFKAGDVVIETPWLRATPRGASVAGGYMKIINNGKEPDRLVAATLEGAPRVELHEMSMHGDVMQMRPQARGIEIAPGATVELAPGGLHVMGLDLTRGFKEGERVKGTLTFEKAGKVEIEYRVGPVGAASPSHAPGHKH